MQKTDDTTSRWEPRPGLAATLRAFALIAPIAASVVFVHIASSLIGPPSGSTLRHVVWWVGLSACATLVLIGIDRLTRRLLPLAALLKLALVFPDEAPSRFRSALRAGTTEELETRLAQAREGADPETPVEAAERLLGYVAALSAHDHVTRGHSERVRAYSQMIAKELRLGRDDVDRLNWAALLHDVGKLEIPGEILNKPGRPTEEEWSLIRRHPDAGAALAEPLRVWLGDWTDAISDHHERWDGKGYPKGTEGDGISLAGRIVAVADVFDVMTSARSYKVPGDAAVARNEIARCAGGQFDPRIVRAFLSVSLGRLRLAMGPLSWLAQAPILGRIPLTPGVATVASSAMAMAGSLAAGLVGTTHVPTHVPTPAGAARVANAAYVVHGSRHPRIASPPRGEKSRAVAPPALLAAPLSIVPLAAALLPVESPPAPPSVPPPAPPPPAPAPPAPPPAPPGDVPKANAGPSFAPGAEQRVSEDAGPQRVVAWAGAIRGQGVTFSVSDDNNTLFRAGAEPALDTEGTLTYTPGADVSGTAHVTIRALASEGKRSPPATLTITVKPVNDPPGFVAGSGETVREDSGTHVVTGWAHAITPGAADESEQIVSLHTASSNPALFAAGGQPAVAADGTLTFTPAANASGLATVSVVAVDDGGTSSGGSDRSAAQTFLIAVTPVNDAPRFVAGAGQATLEDSGAQLVAGWATAIAAGPGDEAGQAVSFAVTSDNPGLFTAGGRPAVAADGTLTYTPAPDASGAATVTVRAVDDGGTAAGGADTSVPQTLAITVTPVNDAPGFVAGADQSTLENAAPQTVAAWASAVTPGPTDEASQVVSFAVSNSDASLFTAGGQPTVAGDGTLTFAPAGGAHGIAVVTVRAVDTGGTAAGGLDASAPQTFTITLVNQAPTANADTPSVPENDTTGVTFNVLVNDTDPESDPLGVVSYDDSTIANGGLTSNGGGSFTYVPATHFAGTDTFSYTVSDGAGNTATAVVTITVTPVPDPPAAADDAYVTPQGVTLVQAAPGLLQNDADSGGGALIVDTTPVVAPANGVLTLAADGSFTYTPAPGFVGSDTFTYRATSVASGLHADAVATITVAATFTSSLLYLTGSGPSSEVWNLSAAAPASSLFVPDYDNDGAPGLTIKSGDGQNHGDPRRSQTWRYQVVSALVLNGPVTLHLSSSANNKGTAFAYLYDCTSGGASCVQIAYGSLYDDSWNGFLSWGQHDISVGTVNRTIAAGHELRLELQVGHGNQWVAMTAALPSSLSLTTP